MEVAGVTPVAPGPLVMVAVLPACVMVNTGGVPVLNGPSVAGPEAGCVAVAPPSEEPPMTDCTTSGT